MSNIETIELGSSTAIFVSADKLIETLTQLGLLPNGLETEREPRQWEGH